MFWQPDGRALFVRGRAVNGKESVFRVTLDGRVTEQPGLDLGAGAQISADEKPAAFSAPVKEASAVVRLKNIVPPPIATR